MTNPNKVIIRSYCESACDCPTCHDGLHTTKVEECAYCQLKWANKGQYDPEWRKKHRLGPCAEYTPRQNRKSDEQILQILIRDWRQQNEI